MITDRERELVAQARELGATDDDLRGVLRMKTQEDLDALGLGSGARYEEMPPTEAQYQEMPPTEAEYQSVTDQSEEPENMDSLFAGAIDPSSVEGIENYDSLFDAIQYANGAYATSMSTMWMGANKAYFRMLETNDPSFQEYFNKYEEYIRARKDIADGKVISDFTRVSKDQLESGVRQATITGNIDEATLSQAASGSLPATSVPAQVAANSAVGGELAKSEPLAYNAYLMNMNEALENAGMDTSQDGIFRNLWQFINTPKEALATGAAIVLPGRASAYNWIKYDFGNLDMRKYQKMSIPEQQALQKRMVKLLKDKNASRFDSMIMMGMMDPTASALLEEGFFLLDIVGGIYGLKSIAKIIDKLNSLNMANRLIDAQRVRKASGTAAAVGDKNLAGELTAAAIVGDANSARRLGQSKIEALLDASPIDYDSLDKSLVPNLSASANRALERQRKIAYYEMVKAFSEVKSASVGLLRSGAEQMAAFDRISKTLPENASIVEKTPYGVRIRVVFENKSRFATPEDELAAFKNHEALVLEHERAVNAVDDYVQQLAEMNGGVLPEAKTLFDMGWTQQLNSLEAAKSLAKIRMDEAEKILDIGRAKDKVEDRFIFYTVADDITNFNGDVRVAPSAPAISGQAVTSPDISLAAIDPLPGMPLGSGGMAQIVIERTVALAQQDKLRRAFGKMIVKLYRDGGVTSNTGAMLLHGRNTEKTFTAKELAEGIDIPNYGTVRLSEKEIAAYQNVRMIADQAHRAASVMKYKEYGARGFSRQTVVNIGDRREKLILQELPELPSGITRIYDSSARGKGPKVVTVDSAYRKAMMEKISSGEYVVTKLANPLRIAGENSGPLDFLEYALIKRTRITEMDTNVLPYRKGYIPTDYIEIPYVVRFQDTVLVNGKEQAKYLTSRFFSSKVDAQAFADTETLRTGKKHEVDFDKAWQQRDNAFSDELNESLLTGLYYGPRGEQIKFGAKGELAPTDDPFSAMERYLGNVAWAYPMNDFRMGVVERFQKTYGHLLKNADEWYNPNPVFKEGVPFSQQENVKLMRDYVRNALSISEPGERLFARTARAALESAERLTHGTVLDKARVKALYGIQDFDVFRTLRRGAFYGLLAGSPVQFLVQLSNIAQIITASPLNAPRALPRLFASRIAHTVSPANPTWDRTMAHLAKLALMSEDKFKDMIRSMHDSGFVHLAYNNSDLAARARGLSPGGTMRDVGRTIKNLYASPYIEGELNARIYGWIDAYTRISRKRKGTKFADSIEGRQEIFNEASRVSQNYTAANAAVWQRSDTWVQNLTSSMFQFYQPVVKFLENLYLPLIPGAKYQSRWTKAERGTVALGHVILFGSFGAPFMWQWTQEQLVSLYENLTGKRRDQLSDKELVALTGGVVDLFASEIAEGILGQDNVHPVLSKRISLANIEQITSKFDENTPIYEILLGAGVAVPMKTAKALEIILPATHAKLQAGVLTTEDVFNALGQLGQALSVGYSNAARARTWQSAQAILYSEFDNPLYAIDPEDPRGIVAMKEFGVQSYEELAGWEVEEALKSMDVGQRVQEVEQKLDSLMLDYLQNADKSDWRELQRYKLLFDIVINELKDEDGFPESKLQNEVRSRFLKRMTKSDTRVGKLLEEIIDLEINNREDIQTPAMWEFIKQQAPDRVYREGY